MKLLPFALLFATACSAQVHIYGPALRADSLSNIPLNGRGITVSWQFTATRTEPIIGFRLTSPTRAGYTAGTGGTILAQIGTCWSYLFQNSTDPYALMTVSQCPVVAGSKYTITVQNVADDPVNNWRSVDGLSVSQLDPLDIAAGVSISGIQHETNNPMWEVLYASTIDSAKSPTAQGVGYVDVPNGASVALPNARECFTPTTTITVASGAISLRGYTGGGVVSLAGQSVALYPPTVPNGWAPFYFQRPIVIPAGTQQCLQPFGTASAVPLQKGWYRASDGITKLYNFGPQTFFNDGNAQQLVNGVWQDWISEQGAADPRMDLMFYLVTQ
jgi:hypothetical protein